jgi:hypothetical protein
MRKTLIFFTFILFATAVRAAEVPWPAKLGDWTADSAAATKPTTSGEESLLKEAGLVSTNTKTYHAGGNRTIPVTLYTFKDSSGAYEAYAFLNGVFSRADTNHTLLVNGNLVLHIPVLPWSSTEIRPVEKWLASASDHVASPPIATYLPGENRYPISERYALGKVGFQEAAKETGSDEVGKLADVAGFESHAEAMFAKYKDRKDEATLLLIEYPTPQLAELHMRHLRRALADAKMTTSSIERKGSLLSIVLTPTSAEYAEKLRGSVNYETSVTWNEASQTATDPPILSTVAKIFIATGVFMVVTVVIGIAFGGVRIITKRLFPGKVFDRKDQIEVLQLGLSSKPIDPSDMY